MSKLEFHIQKTIQGGTTNLEALTIQETTALIEILSALKNIAIHENNLDVKIGVVNQSACALLDGEDEDMDYIHVQMLKVVHNEKDRDNVYVNNLQKIKEQVSENKFEMKIVYRKGDDVKDIKDYFKGTFHKRRIFKRRESSFIIAFMEGAIKKSGESGRNWGTASFKFESKGIPTTISCTEPQAGLAGKFLYKEDSKIAAWGKVDTDGNVRYTCADIYLEGSEHDYYSEFKNFFKEFTGCSEVERIKLIHYKLKEYYSKDMLDHAKKFIRLFANTEAETGYLLSILVLSKNYMKRNELLVQLDEIQTMLSAKRSRN